MGNSASSLNFLTNTRLQAHAVDKRAEKGLETVLSGKNLLNLTQSAAARASREQKVSHVITGPFQATTMESPQNTSVEIQKIFSGM